MAKSRGSVRRNQLITTYGVGAVVAVEDESFMVAGIDRWTVGDPDLHEPRLERRLHVAAFAQPPASDHGTDIPVVRFPRYVSCPECKRLALHNDFTSFDSNRCPECERDLVPSRFVMACMKGHIDDFPYFSWLHLGVTTTVDQHSLRIEATGNTASLRSIVLSCSCGVEPKTMEGAFAKAALKGVSKCTGNRPWLGGDRQDCDEMPRTLQRGASNVWFASVDSALSIPPWSEAVFRYLNKHWELLKHLDEGPAAQAIEGMQLPAKSGIPLGDFIDAIRERKTADPGDDVQMERTMRDQEFQALSRGRPEDPSRPDFVCEPAPGVGLITSRWFDKVMLVRRLREVRALRGFTRILPPSSADETDRSAAIYRSSPGWLPAIVVTGEGVFLSFREELVAAWESQPAVRARAAKVNRLYADKFAKNARKPDRTVTPRLLLGHTFAHTLINQWALDCGYPASALRERLYVTDGYLAVLIYTATTDSAGSLGGVIAQAEPDRLDTSIYEALQRAAWCSADPLCIESEAAGVDSLNLAACHACVLLPEVSCEEMNVLLDRGMMVGVPLDQAVGFFADH